MASIQPKMRQSRSSQSPTRTLPTWLAALALATLLTLGGYQLCSLWLAQPKSPPQIRKMIRGYLRQRSGREDLTAAIPPALLETQARPGARPQAEPRRPSGPAILQRQTPLLPGLAVFRHALEQAPDYETVYAIIGASLSVSDQLLASTNAQHHPVGVLVAAESGKVAAQTAANPWLAARIAQAYIWPSLELFDQATNQPVTSPDLLLLAQELFRQAKETNHFVHNSTLLLERLDRSTSADMTRFRLARLLEEQGHLREALQALRQVQATNSTALRSRIAALEDRLRQP